MKAASLKKTILTMAVIKRSVSVLRDVMNRVAVLKPKRSVSQILDLLIQEPITKDLELVEIEHNISMFLWRPESYSLQPSNIN